MRTHDASWVLMMHHEHSWCIMSAHDASWILIMHHQYLDYCILWPKYGTGPSLGENEPTNFPGSTFEIVRFSVLEIVSFCKMLSKHMLVECRGINNKGVLERPKTKWRVLRAISTTLKCQFTVKFWKVDFLTSSKTKSCQSSTEKFRMPPPGHP